MAELRSAIFWVLCPKQSLHCYTPRELVDFLEESDLEDRLDLQDALEAIAKK